MNGKKYILCVDDVLDVRVQLERELAAYDEYQVRAFGNYKEAEEFLDSPEESDAAVALVVFDHRVPEGPSSWHWLEWLNVRHPEARKIFLTGQSTDEDLEHAVNVAKIHGYMRKPWVPDDLRKLVQKELHSWEELSGDPVARAVAEWVDQHPRPDEKVLAVGGGQTYSPRDILRHVRGRTEFGEEQRKLFTKISVDLFSRGKAPSKQDS